MDNLKTLIVVMCLNGLSEGIIGNSTSIISNMLKSASIEHLVILTDIQDSGQIGQHDIPSVVTEYTSITTVFTSLEALISSLPSMILDLLEVLSIDKLRRFLNFLVVCSTDCINNVLLKVHKVDAGIGMRSVLRHFSTWILLQTDGDSDLIMTRSVLLDNINLVSQFLGEWRVQSLYWGHRGREWIPLNVTPGMRKVFPNTQNGLNGRSLLVAQLEYSPYILNVGHNGSRQHTGTSVEILNALAKVYNFSITFVEPEDQLWGHKTNGTWNGIMGMAFRGEVDLCGVPYAMNIERSEVITFSYPVAYEYHSGVFKPPLDTRDRWLVLLSGFRWEVYMYGLVTLAVVVTLLVVVHRVSPFEELVGKGSRNLNGLEEVAFLGITVPLHQGAATLPESPSFRVLLSFWWLFCIVITSVYTGNMVAFLTVHRENLPFTTLEEVAHQTQYEVGVNFGNYLHLVLEASILRSVKFGNPYREHVDFHWHSPRVHECTQITTRKRLRLGSNDTTLQRIRSKLSPSLSGGTWQTYTSRLNNGQYVFLTNQRGIDVIMAETCHLSKLREDFMPSYSAFMFPKLSPLAQFFSKEIIALTQSGLIETWNRKWTPKPRTCAKHTSDQKLRVENLYSAFLACLVGISMASIVLVYENRYRIFHY